MQFGSKGNIKLRLRERTRKVEMDGEIIIEQVVIFFLRELPYLQIVAFMIVVL